MTAQVATGATLADEARSATVRRVRSRLRDASNRLHPNVSPAEVRAARRAIDDAERVLGSLVHDPWEPSVGPLREAREILSSHLLAAAACEGADVARPVTARVLRRGAESAQVALAKIEEHAGAAERPF